MIVDVTKQVQAEEALRRQQERYKLAIEAASDGIWDWNIRTDESFLSPRWKEILGFAPDEGGDTGAWFFSLIHPDDRDIVAAAKHAHITTGAPYQPEFRMRTKTGEIRWRQSRGKAEFDEHGAPVRMIGATADITDRKLSEERFRVLFECSSHPHLLLDETGVLDCNNAALEAMHCHSRDELIGKRPAELSPQRQPDGRLSSEAADAFIAQAHTTGFARFEWIIRRFDAEEFPVEITLNSVEIAGKPALLIVWNDLTERKRAEAEHARLLETLSERVKEMRTLNRVLAILQQEDKQGVDDALARIAAEIPAGFTRPEQTAARITYQGRHHATPGFAPGACMLIETFRASDASEGAVEIVRHIHDEDEVNNPFLDEERELLAIIADAIRVNIDRCTAAEHLRDAKEAAEAASAAKSAFLANMSHEIRTPMTAIIGYTEFLSNPDQPHDERASCVEVIRRNGEHLLTVVNDILDISRIESGRMRVEAVTCDHAAIVRECVSLLRQRADGKGISLTAAATTTAPRTIFTDPTRLRQILLNLMGNAIKFTESGSVSVELACPAPGENDDTIAFDVVDTGAGIDHTQRAKLFQPFSQADASSTRSHGGAGLGLVISRRLAELMGGDVRIVDSAPGSGSCFRLTLPAGAAQRVQTPQEDLNADTAPAPAASSAHKPDRNRLTGRVLLVEDGPDNQRLISFHLRRAGADVHVASNGREGVDAAHAARDQGAPFDLIVVDMQMPVLDGYAATRALRADNFDTPIIALTAHAMQGDREKCLDAGCDAYATKPIDAQALIDACADAVRSAQRSTP